MPDVINGTVVPKLSRYDILLSPDAVLGERDGRCLPSARLVA